MIHARVEVVKNTKNAVEESSLNRFQSFLCNRKLLRNVPIT